MLWHGRLNGCGLLLPEDKQADICHRWKNAVACGRLPSPAPRTLSPLSV